jgi:hypothetical protein
MRIAVRSAKARAPSGAPLPPSHRSKAWLSGPVTLAPRARCSASVLVTSQCARIDATIAAEPPRKSDPAMRNRRSGPPSDLTDREPGEGETRPVDLVRLRPEGDVVAEALGGLVRVGAASTHASNDT